MAVEGLTVKNKGHRKRARSGARSVIVEEVGGLFVLRTPEREREEPPKRQTDRQTECRKRQSFRCPTPTLVG